MCIADSTTCLRCQRFGLNATTVLIQRGLRAIHDEQPYSVNCRGAINPVAPDSFYQIRIPPGKSVKEGLFFVEERREFLRTHRNSEINTINRIFDTFQEIMLVRTLNSGTWIKSVSIPERSELPVTHYYCNKGRVLKEFPTQRLSSFVRCMAKMCRFKRVLWAFNPLNAELNPICHLLALLGVHFLHVSRIRVKSF